MKTLMTIILFIPFLAFSMEGVKVGDKVPVKSFTDVDGSKIDLTSKDKKVLVFYRGSWCPYCLKQLKSVQSDIVDKYKGKAQIIAVSVDKKSVAKKMKSKNNFSFNVVSDPKASSLKAFKIANKIEDKLVEKYKTSYKIDVEGDSGETHHIVAHPAVFIVSNGKIVYADVHTNYKERTKNSEIIKVIDKK